MTGTARYKDATTTKDVLVSQTSPMPVAVVPNTAGVAGNTPVTLYVGGTPIGLGTWAADDLSGSTVGLAALSLGLLWDGTNVDRARRVLIAPAGTASADTPLWAASDLTGSRINTAASGDTALVAAVASQTTRVHALRLSVAGAVIVQIKDGATVLEVFNFAGNGGSVVLDFRSRPWYSTTVNTALNINLSAAVQVDGRIEYVTSV